MRGYQKRVIYMKNPGSAVFEEAYFVLRDGEETAGGTFDIIEEANRIIKENTDEEKRSKNTFFKCTLPIFLTGFLIGAAVLSVVLNLF